MTDEARVDAMMQHLRETRFDETGIREVLRLMLVETRARAVAEILEIKKRYTCPKRRALCQAIADSVRRDVRE